MTRFIAGFLWLGVTLMAGILLLRSRRSAKAVGASELRYRRLFESAKDGILILDAETGMIVDVNPFLIELLGFPREAFLGKGSGNWDSSRTSSPTRTTSRNCSRRNTSAMTICR